jgi:hypothetical protein
MHVVVIVPFSRPEMHRRTLDNIERQRDVSLSVIVVENGVGVGTWSPSEDVTVLRCARAHPAAAKNVALAHLREQGGGLCAIFDDDDHYGAEYLRTQIQALEEHPDSLIVGKKLHFVSRRDGLWLCRAPERDGRAGWLMGGTHVFDTRRVHRDYPLLLPGEDSAFCAGLECWATGWSHYCNRREHGRHASSDPVERTRALGRPLLRVHHAFDAALVDGEVESSKEWQTRALSRLGAPWVPPKAS